MTPGKKRILIVDTDPSGTKHLRRLLEESETSYVFDTTEASHQALDTIYSDPPDLVIINQSLETDEWKRLCLRIRSDTVFGHLPIVLVVKASDGSPELDWEDTPVDDYLKEPLDAEEVRSRISLIFARAARVRDANPLTRLPGNYSIMTEIQSRIDGGSSFAVGCVDLDHFKPYNDYYGFVRGDEIIRMTARLLTNTIRKLNLPEAFVGHVGGDDFVFIVPPDKLDSVCEEIIRNFDLLVGDFYDESDRMRGYIECQDRQGAEQRFALGSVSIAVVTNQYQPIKHIGQLSAIAAELKTRVKAMKGSNYLKDLRGSGGQRGH